jgi:hypothetical protein
MENQRRSQPDLNLVRQLRENQRSVRPDLKTGSTTQRNKGDLLWV